MARVLIPLADGCEELEAVTLIDLLRRAGIEVITAGLQTGPVTASRGVKLLPDTTLAAVLSESFDMLLLPGGGKGADALAADTRVLALLQTMAAQQRYTAAICAAPKALAVAGLLENKRATSFPGSLSGLNIPGLQYVEDAVVQDGTVLTSRGPGTVMDFALHIIELLTDRATRDKVEAGLQRPKV